MPMSTVLVLVTFLVSSRMWVKEQQLLSVKVAEHWTCIFVGYELSTWLLGLTDAAGGYLQQQQTPAISVLPAAAAAELTAALGLAVTMYLV